MVAIDGALLLQVPPPVPSLNIVVVPIQARAVPVIADTTGTAFTVTGMVTKQPADELYVIVAVPADTPVTTPNASMNAVPGALDDQVPPMVASVNVVVVPIHTVEDPLIAKGSG